MRILLTNDDGIHAEGLVALEKIARVLSDDIWICAPEYEQSGASRALTLSDPIRVRTLDPRRFATTGTPTDCVMLAIHELMGGLKPDLVLSGVNRGANLAEDVTLSGTVAGAIEGMALGVPSIALSATNWPVDDQDIFAPAEHFGPGIVRKLFETGWPAGVSSAPLINVAPSFTSAGSLTVFFTLAGSVTLRVYDWPFTAASWKRPRPSCSVRKVATCLPFESTITPAMSAGFCERVRASR